MTNDDVEIKESPNFTRGPAWDEMISLRRKFPETGMMMEVAEPFIAVYGEGFSVVYELKDKRGKYSFQDLIRFVINEIDEKLIYRNEFAVL